MAINPQKTPSAQNWLNRQMAWATTADPEFPYAAKSVSQQCLIRLNDFPNQHLYTLLVEDEAVAEFDDWPSLWRRAAQTPAPAPEKVLSQAG